MAQPLDLEEARRQEDAVERLTVEPCSLCACGSCMADRAEVTDWMARVSESLIVLTDRQRAEQLHSPAIRALAGERNRLQRLALVIGQYLDGTASREALAFTLNDVIGDA